MPEGYNVLFFINVLNAFKFALALIFLIMCFILEIGVNLRSDSYIKYSFENTISTLEEQIRVGFTTTDKTGMIFGISSYSGEYLNLMMSTSGKIAV